MKIEITNGQEYVTDVDNDRCELHYPLSVQPTDDWVARFLDSFNHQIQFYRHQIQAAVNGDEVVILCFKLQDRPQIQGQVAAAISTANELTATRGNAQ